MDQQAYIELIEQYLNHELSEQARLDFESKLTSDTWLAAELERRRTAHRMIDFMVAENLRSQLKSLEAKDTKVVPLASRKRTLSIFAIAASVIILIGAFFVFIPGNSPRSSQQLALDFYQTPTFTMRGAGSDQINLHILQGTDALRSQEYQAAVSEFSQVDNTDPYYILAQYYLGHAQFLNKEYQAARQHFGNVVASGDIRYVEDAQWYQLLSCLGETDDCQSYLQIILDNPEHSFSPQAQDLLATQSK